MKPSNVFKKGWDNVLLKVRHLWEKLLHQQATPSQVAKGFAIGIFISFLPIFPFQTLIGLAMAFFLRSNKIAFLLGLNFHLIIFPAIPLVFLAEYEVGRKLLYLHQNQAMEEPLNFNIMYLMDKGLPILKAMFLGSFVLGVPIAVASYFFVKPSVARWQKLRKEADRKAA